MNRRSVLAGTAGLVVAPALTRPALAAPAPTAARSPGPICFFSKHLPDMAPAAMAKAKALRAVGFGGVELTVRPGGHVLPEKVTTDLPRAAEAIRAESLELAIVATAFTDASDPTVWPILSTAGKLGVPLCRPGWYSYSFLDQPAAPRPDVRHEVRAAARSFAGLVTLGQRAHVQLAYQNHGAHVGAAGWDAAALIDPVDPRWGGFYFDMRHAVADGGFSAWKVAEHLAGPRLKAIGVKDFYWDKSPQGQWRLVSCPLGQGMVDLPGFLRLAAGWDYRGPFSVFIEYDPGAGSDKMLAPSAIWAC